MLCFIFHWLSPKIIQAGAVLSAIWVCTGMDSPGWKQGGHRRQAEAGQNTEIVPVQWARLGVRSPLCVSSASHSGFRDNHVPVEENILNIHIEK